MFESMVQYLGSRIRFGDFLSLWSLMNQFEYCLSSEEKWNGDSRAGCSMRGLSSLQYTGLISLLVGFNNPKLSFQILTIGFRGIQIGYCFWVLFLGNK